MEAQSLEERCGHSLVKKIDSIKIDKIKRYKCLDCNDIVEDRENTYVRNFSGHYDKRYI